MYSKYTLQKHLKLHGEIKSLYSCDQCPRSFHYQSQLERHRAKHSGASGNAMTCQHCGKHYMHKKSLDRHIQVDHMGVKDYPYKCDQCPAQFFDSVQLRDHVAFRHQNLRRYKCRLCAESFVCRPTMARHMRRDHDGYSPYICKVCGEKFVEKMQLLKHQVVHTGVEPFQCTVCSKTFTRPRSLKLHMNLHNGIRPFACEGCGKAYVKKSHLERHRKKCKTLAADPSPDLIPKPDTSDSEQHQKKNQSPKRDNGPCTDPDSKPGLNLTLHHNANLDANLNRNPNHSPDHKLHLNMNPAPSSLLNPVGQTVIVLPPGSQIL
nr:hypothetical protein BaRGS_004631 [Batillaria attramentaria]